MEIIKKVLVNVPSAGLFCPYEQLAIIIMKKQKRKKEYIWNFS
jgi:hypothetical protein